MLATLTVILACISYFFPFLPTNLQLSSSTLADIIWNLSWLLGKTDSRVLISCLRVFRQAIWGAERECRTPNFSAALILKNTANPKETRRTWWIPDKMATATDSFGQFRAISSAPVTDDATGPFKRIWRSSGTADNAIERISALLTYLKSNTHCSKHTIK